MEDMQKVLRWMKELNSSNKTLEEKWSDLSRRVVESVHGVPELEPPTQSQAHKGRWQTFSGLTQRALDVLMPPPYCGRCGSTKCTCKYGPYPVARQ